MTLISADHWGYSKPDDDTGRVLRCANGGRFTLGNQTGHSQLGSIDPNYTYDYDFTTDAKTIVDSNGVRRRLAAWTDLHITLCIAEGEDHWFIESFDGDWWADLQPEED